MNENKLAENILQSLLELEQQGELILTTNFGPRVARSILNSVLTDLLTDFGAKDEPMECTMPYLLEQTVQEVMQRFGVPNQRAREITGRYYNSLTRDRTVEQIAERYWHETPGGMAKRSYYRVELGKNDEDFEYLDWRREH